MEKLKSLWISKEANLCKFAFVLIVLIDVERIENILAVWFLNSRSSFFASATDLSNSMIFSTLILLLIPSRGPVQGSHSGWGFAAYGFRSY